LRNYIIHLNYKLKNMNKVGGVKLNQGK